MRQGSCQVRSGFEAVVLGRGGGEAVQLRALNNCYAVGVYIWSKPVKEEYLRRASIMKSSIWEGRRKAGTSRASKMRLPLGFLVRPPRYWWSGTFTDETIIAPLFHAFLAK